MATARADWDRNTTKVFLDLCIAEKEKLNFNFKKGLNKIGWKNVCLNFRQQTQRTYSSKQLQNKFNSLKRLYKLWHKLKNKTEAGWDNNTGAIVGDDAWWEDRIRENPDASQLRNKPLAHENELTILFGGMETEEGDMLCAGGIGDRTPSGGSPENTAPESEENVGRSGVGRAQRSRKEQVVDSPEPKKTKSMEYYVEQISESMLQRSRNETSTMRQEQAEVDELLRVLEEDGVSQVSQLYLMAAELLGKATRRAAFRRLRDAEARRIWIEWTWENTRKK